MSPPDDGREVTGPELDWLRSDVERIRSQLDALEAGLAHQRSAFIDIAGARTSELRDALGEVVGATASLRKEADHLRALQEAVAERLHEVVVETVRPELRASLGQQLPHLVVEALAPDLRQALSDWLPTFVVEAVRPELRRSLDERLPGVVADVVTPEVRRTLGERLPHLVAETVRPEIRQAMAERLPGIVAQAVSPEVGALLAERLPGMLAEAVSPELSVSLAELESCAADLRGEVSKMRTLREIVAERLPQAVMAAIEPQLDDMLVNRFPKLLTETVEPMVHQALTSHLPALVAESIAPEVGRALASQLPALVAERVEPELREAMGRAMAERLPVLVADSVHPQVREVLDGTLPAYVAGALVDALRIQLDLRLPGVVAETVGPDLSVSLSEIEGCAAEMRHETARLRNLRETIAERMPHALVSSVQPVFEDLLGVRLPNMLSQTVGPALHDALGGHLASLVEEAVRQEVRGALNSSGLGEEGTRETRAAIAQVEATLDRLREEAVALREARDDLAHEVPRIVASAVRSEMARFASATAALGSLSASASAAPATSSIPTAGPGAGAGPPQAVAGPTAAVPGSRPGGTAGQGQTAGLGQTAGQGQTAAGSRAVPEPSPPAGRETDPGPPPAAVACVLPGVAVGPTLARGISASLHQARARRRRRRGAGPPAAGLHRYDPFAGELTKSLERFAIAQRSAPPSPAGGTGRGSTPDAPDAPAGHVAAGELAGAEVALPLSVAGGLSLCGLRARDAARALVLTFLAANDPEAGRAVVVGELLPPSPGFPGLTRARDLASVLTGLEVEAELRRELLRDAGAGDLAAYRVTHPDDARPLLLVVAAELPGTEQGRLQAVLADGDRTGIAALLIDVLAEGLPVVRLETGAVVGSVPAGLPEYGSLVGARLFTVDRDPAAELLGVLADARTDVEGDAASDPPNEPFRVQPVEQPLIDVSILGGYRIEAGGREIRSGLRAKARELLAFYLLHPEGTSLEEATEALWPEADPGRGSEWFWTALGNLRSRLRAATGDPEMRVIEREGDRYRIEDVFDVDLWRFQLALGEAASSGGEPNWASVLEGAADLYSGELLAGADWAWAEVPRDDLRRRAVDVMVSLAATRLVGSDVKGALQALQLAVDADPLAEQLYRRIMRLQARISRPDEVESTYRALNVRLREIGLEPSVESEKLRQELAGAD